MKPIAVFLHCRISGGDPNIPFDHAIGILAEQIILFQRSGLTGSADAFFIGVNGGETDAMAVQSIKPDKAIVIQHPDGARGEHPTLRYMQEWLPEHRNWNVCYSHLKGATHPGDATWAAWRACMSRVVIEGWRDCVRALEAGFDTAGAHWITSENCSIAPVTPYWGGNFFWATADFLSTLPLIAPTAVERGHFYDAEVLIARGKRKAKARDFCPHFPGAACLQAMGARP